MEQNSIVVKNVTKKFDDFMLDHISFTVPTGRIVGFIGENGAGKSTTINLILDQLKLDTGEIRIWVNKIILICIKKTLVLFLTNVNSIPS